MATVADVRRIAPEFAEVPDATVQQFIDDATLEVVPAVWGKYTDRAITLLACHSMAISYPHLAYSASGGVGGVTSEKVGDISRSYGSGGSSSSSSASAYSSTRFGLEYERLRRRLGLITYGVV